MNFNLSLGDLVDNIFSGFRKITPALIATEATAGLILFAPNEWLEKIHIANMPELVLGILGVIFIVSSFLLIINMLSFVNGKVQKLLRVRKMENSLKKLSFMEQQMVSLMYYSPSNSLLMSYYGQTKGALQTKSIIVQTTSVSSDIGNITFSYMLQPWVVDYIRKHPKFLTMTKEESILEYERYYRGLDNGEAF